VRDFRCAVGVKSSNDVLQRAIGIGDAFMLAQMLMLDLPPPESVYRRLSLPQRGRRVLWEDLNCSEWRHGKRIADRAGKLAERKPSWWAGLSSNRYRGRVGTSGVASDTEMLII
jgi:hypothetical protein